MKRRKWWLIAVSLALLAACALGWVWSEQPAYAFMKGARLYYVKRLGDECLMHYALDMPADEVLKLAEAETGQGTWKPVQAGSRTWRYTTILPYRYVDIADLPEAFLKERNDRFRGKRPTVPETAKTAVSLYRKATLGDRLKGWFHDIPFKGMFP